MRANPVVANKFNYSYLDIDIDIDFPDNLTFVTGESATGKSFLYAIFNTAQSSNSFIETFNYTSLSKDLLSIIKSLSDRLIIIDNADILLDNNLRKHIAFDFRNQYMIIGRDPRNLMLMNHQVKEVKFSDNILSLV